MARVLCDLGGRHGTVTWLVFFHQAQRQRAPSKFGVVFGCVWVRGKIIGSTVGVKTAVELEGFYVI